MFGAVRKLIILNYFHIFKYKIKQLYSKGGMLFIYRKWMHAQREQSFFLYTLKSSAGISYHKSTRKTQIFNLYVGAKWSRGGRGRRGNRALYTAMSTNEDSPLQERFQ